MEHPQNRLQFWKWPDRTGHKISETPDQSEFKVRFNLDQGQGHTHVDSVFD